MKTRTKAITGLAGIFIVGIALGATGVGLYVRHQVNEVERLRDRDGFHQYFTEKLELSERQHDSLRTELEKAYDELNALRQNTAEQYHTVLDSFTTRISPKLSEHQRELLRVQTTEMRQAVPVVKRKEVAVRRIESSVPNNPPSMTAESKSTTIENPVIKDTHVLTDKTTKIDQSKASPPLATVTPSEVKSPAMDTAAREMNMPDETKTPLSVEPQSPEEMPDKREALVQRYRTQLGLSDEQAARIRNVVVLTGKRIVQARRDAAGNLFEFRRQKGMIMKDSRAAIFEILTPDQRETFKGMMAKKLLNGGVRNGAGGGGQ